MALSRRTLLYTSMLTAVGAHLPWPLTHAEGATANLAGMTSDTFLPYVNTRFSLLLSRVRVATVTLVEVEVFDPPADGTRETASQDGFSLVFRGPRQPLLRQETYTVRHAILGTFPLLLVPVGRQRAHYEAVFNRLRT
jgi:uncharacterized protein DUF6916